MREVIADGLVLLGCGLFVTAGWLVSPVAGLGVLGFLFALFGVFLAARGKSDDR